MTNIGRLLLMLLWLMPIASAENGGRMPSLRPLFRQAMPRLSPHPPPGRSEAEAKAEILRDRQRVLEAAIRDALDDLAVASLGMSSCARNAQLREAGVTKLPADGCAAKLRELSSRYKAATEEISIEAAINAERLYAYKQTGVLPPPKPFDRRVLSFESLSDPDAVLDRDPHPVPGMEFTLDLMKLQKQMKYFQARLYPPPPRSVLPAPTPSAPRISAPPSDRSAARIDPVPQLIAQLSDPDSRRRALAADALAQAGPSAEQAIEPLVKAAADLSPRVRASAVLALGRIASEDAAVRVVILRAQDDPSEDVRYSARAALHD